MADDTSDLDLSNPTPLNNPATEASRTVVKALWPEAATKNFWKYQQNPNFDPSKGNYKYGSQPGLGDAALQGATEAAGWVAPEAKGAAVAAKSAPFWKAVLAGPKAGGANLRSYQKALDLMEKGRSPKEIMDATNWFPRQSGQLAYEISDKKLTTNPLINVPPQQTLTGRYRDFVNNPDLFSAYPEIANHKLTLDPAVGKGGYIYPKTGDMTIGGKIDPKGLTPEQQEWLAHETQHLVQGKEGWPVVPGTETHYKYMWKNVKDPEYQQRFADLLKQTTEGKAKLEEIKKLVNTGKLKSYSYNRQDVEPAFAMYHHSPSETEARNAQNRFLHDKFGSMIDRYGQPILKSGNPSDYKYPWKTEDVPREQQFDFWKHIKPPGSD